MQKMTAARNDMFAYTEFVGRQLMCFVEAIS